MNPTWQLPPAIPSVSKLKHKIITVYENMPVYITGRQLGGRGGVGRKEKGKKRMRKEKRRNKKQEKSRVEE